MPPVVAQGPPLIDFIPGGYLIDNDFKFEKASIQRDRGKEVWGYVCSITEETLEAFREDYKWEGNGIVIPSLEEDIPMYVEGYLGIYTYPFTFGHMDTVVLEFFKRYEICLG